MTPMHPVAILWSSRAGRGRENWEASGVRIVCMGVFVSIAALVSAMSPLKVKARYQQKALDAGNKINVGIELKILGLKVIELLAYHEIFTWCLQQEIDASRSIVFLEKINGTSSSASASVSYTN